jgi:hypothetical protein
MLLKSVIVGFIGRNTGGGNKSMQARSVFWDAALLSGTSLPAFRGA